MGLLVQGGRHDKEDRKAGFVEKKRFDGGLENGRKIK